MSHALGTVQINSAELERQCKAVLEWVAAAQAEEDRKHEQEWLDDYNSTWIRRLLRRPKKETVTDDDRKQMSGSWWYPSNVSGYYANLARKYLKAIEVVRAHNPLSTVTITIEDLNKLY